MRSWNPVEPRTVSIQPLQSDADRGIAVLCAPVSIQPSQVRLVNASQQVHPGQTCTFRALIDATYPGSNLDLDAAISTLTDHLAVEAFLVTLEPARVGAAFSTSLNPLLIEPCQRGVTVSVRVPLEALPGQHVVVVSRAELLGQALGHIPDAVPVRAPRIGLCSPLVLCVHKDARRTQVAVAEDGCLYAALRRPERLAVFARDGTEGCAVRLRHQLRGRGGCANLAIALDAGRATAFLCGSFDEPSPIVALEVPSGAERWVSDGCFQSCGCLATLPRHDAVIAVSGNRRADFELRVFRASDGLPLATTAVSSWYMSLAADDASGLVFAGSTLGAVDVFRWAWGELTRVGALDRPRPDGGRPATEPRPLAVVPAPLTGARPAFLVVGTQGSVGILVYSLKGAGGGGGGEYGPISLPGGFGARLVTTLRLPEPVDFLAADVTGTALVATSGAAIHVLPWPLRGM